MSAIKILARVVASLVQVVIAALVGTSIFAEVASGVIL
ncbi:putative membrane protein [Neorickettsia helminthoeca str. Oregon]|uniref:Putative membrane protein n=1 Tax=Neorickettsia helminthoeca str. Oregon TaxID=1286528 RepID=X5H3S6_9RICK|nr:putative membrane protein [Neorickettsia helminthoeca str. Oregon]